MHNNRVDGHTLITLCVCCQPSCKVVFILTEHLLALCPHLPLAELLAGGERRRGRAALQQLRHNFHGLVDTGEWGEEAAEERRVTE